MFVSFFLTISSLISSYLIFALALIGIYICSKGMKRKKQLYNWGFWFFVLLSVSEIFKITSKYIVPNLMTHSSAHQLNMWITIFTIPSFLLYSAAFLILVVGFYKNLK